MKLLGVLLAAAVLVPSANADPVRNVTLERQAQQIRGTPVAVYCTDTTGSDDVYGYADVPGKAVYLADVVCGWATTFQHTPGGYFGTYVFLHELVHTTGMLNEGETDCWTLFLLRYELRKVWGFTATEAEAAYAEAWTRHRELAPEYQGGCSPEGDTVSGANGLRGS